MTTLQVVAWPATSLQEKARPVTVFDEELRTFVKDMHETMDHHNGIGLAANQVNSLSRILVIHISHNSTRHEQEEEKFWWHDKRFTFINPVIIKKSGRVKSVEGCLSFPDIFEYVERNEFITVSAQDEFGKTFEVNADGLFAICLQHEIDHLDGTVFINRMSRLKSSMIKKKIQKRYLLNQKGREEYA